MQMHIKNQIDMHVRIYGLCIDVHLYIITYLQIYMFAYLHMNINKTYMFQPSAPALLVCNGP